MILQVLTADSRRIQVSDGMNTAFLNVGREQETVEAMSLCLNSFTQVTDLESSIFVFSDFMFSFEWDYDNKKLMVSIETDNFDFLHLGTLHERIFRSKDLSTVMSNTEREDHKRKAMQKRMPASSGIDLGEMIDVKSKGLDPDILESQLNNKNQYKKKIDVQGNNDSKPSYRSNAPLDKCLLKNGWLSFPQTSSSAVPEQGGLYNSLESFLLEKCAIETPNFSPEEEPKDPDFQTPIKSSKAQPKSSLVANPNKKSESGEPFVSQKTRLRRDRVNVFRDPAQVESPSPMKATRSPQGVKKRPSNKNKLTEEEELELELLGNITKEVKDHNFEKETRKVKLNKSKARPSKEAEEFLETRSSSKVATYLRKPLSDRTYSLRNKFSPKKEEAL